MSIAIDKTVAAPAESSSPPAEPNLSSLDASTKKLAEETLKHFNTAFNVISSANAFPTLINEDTEDVNRWKQEILEDITSCRNKLLTELNKAIDELAGSETTPLVHILAIRYKDEITNMMNHRRGIHTKNDYLFSKDTQLELFCMVAAGVDDA